MEPTTVAGVFLAQLLANHSLLEELAKKASEKATAKLGEHLGEKLAQLGQPLLAQAQKDAQFKDALLALARDRQNVTKQSALRALVVSLLASNPLLAGELAELLEIPPWFPPRKAERFFGRADLISVLTGHLKARRSVTLQGAGGLGKTALASECLGRVAPGPDQPGPFPGGIFSHDYYAKPDHASALMGLLAQAKQDDIPEAAQPARVRELLDRPGVLLYLEGCEKATQLNQLIELSGQATILFTTRDKDQCGQSEIINLHALDARSGAHVLAFHAHLAALPADNAQWQPWEALATRLGGHPLALRLCGTWLQKRAVPPAEFLDRLSRSGFTFWDTSKAEKENLRVLFQHSAEAALGKHPRALEAWFALALHGHAPVPLPPLQAALSCDPDELADALGALADYSLAERTVFPSEQIGQTEPGWQLTHALLGEWGRGDQRRRRREESLTSSPDARPQTPDPVRDSLRRHLPDDGESIRTAWRTWWRQDLEVCFDNRAVPGGPARYVALQPHWESLLTIISQSESPEQCNLSAELNCISETHRMMGSYSLAQPLRERALESCEQSLGQEHLHTLGNQNNLANLLLDKGDLATAEGLLHRAWQKSERKFGAEHPITMMTVSNLIILQGAKGDIAEAESLCRRVLAVREQNLVPNHPDTLNTLISLANLMAEKGNLAEAEPLYRRALAAYELTLGPEHPIVLGCLNNFALLLADKGDLAEAELLYRRVLVTLERMLGPEHPDTLVSLNNLASLLANKGDLVEAEQLVRRAHESMQRSLGPEHPKTFRAKACLAQILSLQGRPDEAQATLGSLYLYGKDGYSEAYFPRLKADFLAAKLIDERRLLPVANQALHDIHRALVKIYGPGHRSTLRCEKEIGELRAKGGDISRACGMVGSVFEEQKKLFGPQDQDTLISQHRLAELLFKCGGAAEAELHARSAVAGLEAKLNKDHIVTLASLSTLAEILNAKSDSLGAEPLAERAAQGFLTKLGPEHPSTKSAERVLAKIREARAKAGGQ